MPAMPPPFHRDPLRLFAVVQLWAAASGSWLVVTTVLRADTLRGSAVAVYAFALVFYSVAGWSGVLILRGAPQAISVTKAALVPQLVGLANAAYSFQVVAGFGVIVYWFGGSGGINLDLTSRFAVFWQRSGQPTGFDMNLLAWGVFIWMVERRADVERRLTAIREAGVLDVLPSTRMDGTGEAGS